jgi:hypothetical protein
VHEAPEYSIPNLPYFGLQYLCAKSWKFVKISGLNILNILKASSGRARIGVPEIKMLLLAF